MPFTESLSKVYVSIVDGKFAVRSSESDPKAVKRELKTGKTIYERYHGALAGKIKEINFKNQDFNGKQWEELQVLMFDGTDHYLVQMPFPSNYSNSFLRAIKNADLTKDVSLSPWRKVVNDKVKSALYINQGGDSIQWYFGTTPETKNGLPDLVPYTIPGSKDVKYSDVDRSNFFRDFIAFEISPALRELWNKDSSTPAESKVPATEEVPEPGDDLPF